MEHYGYIYITTNLVNNKKYIGQHSKWNDSYLGSGKLLLRAIQKYGIENFKKEIIDYADSKEELDELERYYIKIFNATKSQEFYNIHEGGSGGNCIAGYTEEEMRAFKEKMSKLISGENNPMFGRKRTMEEREKMSRAARRRFKNISEEELQKFKETMRKVTTGERNGMYSKKHTEESKRKMSINSKGKTAGEKNGMYGKRGKNAINGQKVYMYDKNWNVIQVFPSVNEALKFLGIIGHTALNKACREGTLYRGYYWKKTFSAKAKNEIGKD